MEEPTPEQFEAHRAVMRWYSAKGNRRLAELSGSDPAFAEARRRNIAKARDTLERKLGTGSHRQETKSD